MAQTGQISSQAGRLARYWLLLGVAALGIAGLFSLVLVIARTPALAKLPGFAGLFHEALVVHVDLSVLVWFLAIACMMWSLLCAGGRSFISLVEEAALLCFAGGTLLIAASPLDGDAEALMSNYIPVITSPLFFLGLALLLCGVTLMIARVITMRNDGAGLLTAPMQFGTFSAALVTLWAIVAFVWSYQAMPQVIEGQQYYELLFWGGGHVLQFTHTQVLMLCWLLLATALNPSYTPRAGVLYAIFAVALVASFTTPLAYLNYDVTDSGHREFFTQQMIIAGGVAPAVLAVMLLPQLWGARHERKGPKRALWAALLMSWILFIYGGVLGGLIRDQNVVIPAHYHGSIVGVTIAFMGAAYALLPRFGCRDVASWRMAFWQPIVYGGGQLMHISGLAWSGGYGVLRKTPGVAQELAPSVKAALGFMGAGGLFAIIGGFMFVLVVIKAVRKA